MMIMVSPAACAVGDDFIGGTHGADRKNIVVGVIDSGISTEIIGEEHVLAGKNYVDSDDSTEDMIGHGTAVSSFIVGSINGKIEGEYPDALLVPLVYVSTDKEGNEINGGPEKVAEAIYDAIDKFGCDLILVASGTSEDNKTLEEAVKYASDNGIPIIAAAGNVDSNSTNTMFFPGAYDSVICVGSLSKNGKPAQFSAQNEKVDLYVIGESLKIITLKGTCIRGFGTSYSAAIVAGKAAEIMHDHPDFSIEEIIEELRKDEAVSIY